MAAKRSRSRKSKGASALPKATQPASNLFCSWVFSLADKGGDWAWKKITQRDLKEVIEKFANFETMPLDDRGRGGSHGVPINELPPKTQARLHEINFGDFNKLYSLHINGKKRVWCTREQGPVGNQILYQILWWDPNHKVYPSDKKHT